MYYSALPKCYSLPFPEKPHFMSRPPLETLGEFGHSLTLPCAVDGSPAPDVTWYRDGVPLSETPNLRFSVLKNNNSLYISYMRQEDSGMFQCLASNEAGDVTAYTRLRVKSKFWYLHSIPTIGNAEFLASYSLIARRLDAKVVVANEVCDLFFRLAFLFKTTFPCNASSSLSRFLALRARAPEVPTDPRRHEEKGKRGRQGQLDPLRNCSLECNLYLSAKPFYVEMEYLIFDRVLRCRR